MFHHRQIVRDEQIRDLPLLLQIIEQIQNLRLDRNIERRNRFIADDEIGRKRKRTGNADALPLPP